MRTLFLFQLALWLTPLGAASAREWPLWDGHETVEAYAKKVNLPPTKSLDLGNGVMLDLVLIPAGQFIMGSPEPAKPNITGEGAVMMTHFGFASMLCTVFALGIKSYRKAKLSFSLRWLLLMTIASGVTVGGICRTYLACEQLKSYETERRLYDQLPDNEKPGCPVTHTQPFYMGKYMVTQSQYEAVMGINPSFTRGAQLPVEFVSWTDAEKFCRKLNSSSRLQTLEVRLPTEAQWEYACRAGTRTLYYSGNLESDLDTVAWYMANSASNLQPVGLKKPNAFGLFDMHGNALQWCQDTFTYHYDTRPSIDPVNNKGEGRIVRGSCVVDSPESCRASHRNWNNLNNDFGSGRHSFRVVVVPLPRTQ